ncbi:hypothetical protein M2447_002714 [Ereboglobus sp. PH5-10]|uniref:hypothetical protein n=1 Tax=Ereboglobus sp. PH5-10 TaxID=2940629 RepID=UPI0024068A33|nr:hypothetical protein [Ereboglobus sp. PH5-10]MDF9828588.1 hypothetical protein [Ereboglobus sp. PH5-10]
MLPLTLFRRLRISSAFIRFFACSLIVFAAFYMIYISWFNWANPQVDFGRELYTAWRLTEGDLPVRDIFRQFGPLSDYWNAFMFYLFGVSLNTLLFANMAIYTTIVILALLLLRRAFGFFPAVIASVLGVLIFGLSDFTGWGNYNYLMPYSHGATHGLLLLLMMMAWVVLRPQNARCSGIPEGLLFGLLCMTKVEFIFAGVFIILISSLRSATVNGSVGGLFYLGKIIITTVSILLSTWGVFCIYLNPGEAMQAAWASFMFSRSGPVHSTFQMGLLGIHDIKGNLFRHFQSTGMFACVFLTWTLFLRYFSKRHYMLVVPMVMILSLLIGFYVNWLAIGYAFIEILLIAGIYTVYLNYKNAKGSRLEGRRKILAAFTFRSSGSWARVILIVGALAMLARMPLTTRIYHYGFYQAMLAGVVCFAFLFGMAPLLAGAAYRARMIFFWALVTISAVGLWQLVKINNFQYGRKTVVFDPSLVSPVMADYKITTAGVYLGAAAKYLEPIVETNDRLVVLPEGIMLNFWLRLKSGTPVFVHFPEVYVLQKDAIWKQLLENPPKYMVCVSRPNIQEYGIPYYGYDNNSGKELLEWVDRNYNPIQQFGDYPFGEKGFGLIIYLHKDASPSGLTHELRTVAQTGGGRSVVKFFEANRGKISE